jgi:hypothetical protein
LFFILGTKTIYIDASSRKKTTPHITRQTKRSRNEQRVLTIDI